jgi:hypothetical protein
VNRSLKRLAGSVSHELLSRMRAAVAGKTMPGSVLRRFKAHALSRPEVRQAYNDVADEFAVLDEIPARIEAGEP